jgi:hypothetical protein
MIVALLSASKAQAPWRASVRDLYRGDLFLAARSYAERHADLWIVLSPRHGVILPTLEIDPYEEVALEDLDPMTRQVWVEQARSRLRHLVPPEAKLLLLAGKEYLPLLAGRPHEAPLLGLRTPDRVRFLRDGIRST